MFIQMNFAPTFASDTILNTDDDNLYRMHMENLFREYTSSLSRHRIHSVGSLNIDTYKIIVVIELLDITDDIEMLNIVMLDNTKINEVFLGSCLPYFIM